MQVFRRQYQPIRGFTIVELLVVIVVIGILAAIVIVAYSGVTARAQYSMMRQDMTSIRKLLELYKTDRNAYPDSAGCVNTSGETNYQSGWCGFDQGQANSFIPGLVPTYAPRLPTLDRSLPQRNSYLYQSRDSSGNNPGTDQYELIRFVDTGLNSAEKSSANTDLMTGSGYDGLGWGFKSNSAASWW